MSKHKYIALMFLIASSPVWLGIPSENIIRPNMGMNPFTLIAGIIAILLCVVIVSFIVRNKPDSRGLALYGYLIPAIIMCGLQVYGAVTYISPFGISLV